ncbi:Glycosyltransferase involved in cell wall bisynthesis [Mariprofundus ferrinatatus]|uniref:Glycosyltransferase involved in cell wall bisynthesis n=1 Tax=Mariprofundus ferrinatatus TaxID=1921087 RepID=A0A2K8L273_9PROT|nr:glycosyltransferase family 4 protein [Mariprofundus ferrinatatus]ATX81430.1 Glycosyltransferase involved in cell wall bisynthesis [Mariprofundus ferrinatatus]
MRVLQVVKTVDGARWAVDQVRELVSHGIEVHVVLPSMHGRFIEQWRQTGAQLHELAMDLPVRRPWKLSGLLRSVRRLVETVRPDVIHSHFFGTSLVLRYALGSEHTTPRIFQVPGPLHLEHTLFRNWELSTAGSSDFWIGSSRCIIDHYLKAGIDRERLFLSYYGNCLQPVRSKRGALRSRLGIGHDVKVIGNINYLYPPKRHLGQSRGLKRHEDVIEALGRVLSARDDVVGLLIGSQWGGGHSYEERLKKMADRIGGGRILMPGHMASEEVLAAWEDFDLAVHVPASENCGGVVEPLQAGIPVIAARVGGLPEVVIDGVTGLLVDGGDIDQLAEAMNRTLDHPDELRVMARRGQKLVTHMFDVHRTAAEVVGIYRHLLEGSEAPAFFDSNAYAREMVA